MNISINPTLIAQGVLGAGVGFGAYAAASSMIRNAAENDIVSSRVRDRPSVEGNDGIGYQQERGALMPSLTLVTTGAASVLGGGLGFALHGANTRPGVALGAAAGLARSGLAAVLVGAGIGGVAGAIASYQSNTGLTPYRID